MATATRVHRDKIPGSFEKLNRWYPLRPIHDDVDLDNAQEIVDRLAILDTRTPDQEDYLETLTLLIERYEEKHHRIDTSNLDAMGTLKFLMKQHGMNASDLGRILGNRQLGSALVRGDRQLSKVHIQKLCAHFGVGPGVFLKSASRARKRGEAR